MNSPTPRSNQYQELQDIRDSLYTLRDRLEPTLANVLSYPSEVDPVVVGADVSSDFEAVLNGMRSSITAIHVVLDRVVV